MRNHRTGTVFAFPLPTEEWMCGRGTLDVYHQCVRPNLIAGDSPLRPFPRALLVEVYRPVFLTSDLPAPLVSAHLLIPGIFISEGCLEKNVWKVVGHHDVAPDEVEFPVTLVSKGPHTHLVRGEIELPIDLSFKDVRAINAYKTEYPCGILGEIVLYQLGRADEIDKPEIAVKLRDLARSDLRFSEHRDRIYDLLGEDKDAPYHQMAKRLGHDLSRFYG